MLELLFPLAAFLICLLVFLAYKTRELHLRKNLWKKVRACVSNDNHIRGTYSLIEWLYEILHCSKNKKWNFYFPHIDKLTLIEEKYWLKKDEDDIVNKILADYQKDLIQKYFSESMFFRISKITVTDAEYFVLTLEMFLEKYYYDYKNCIVAYYKILLIVRTYSLALEEDPFNKNTTHYMNVEYTKKELDKLLQGKDPQ